MRSVLAAAVLTAFVAPAAHAATVSSLSVYSDARDFIGAGVPRVAFPGGPARQRGAGFVRRRRHRRRRRDRPGGRRRRARTAAGRSAAPVQLDADRPVSVPDLEPSRPFGARGQSRLQRRDGKRRGARRRLRRAGSRHATVGALRPPLRGLAFVGVRRAALARLGAGGGGARDPGRAALAGARQLVAGRARHRRLPRQRAGGQRRRGGRGRRAVHRAGRRLHRAAAAVHGRGGLRADGTRRPPSAPGDSRHRRGSPRRDAGGLPPRRHDPGGHRGPGRRRGRAARGPRSACLRARRRALLGRRVRAEPDRVAVRPGRR